MKGILITRIVVDYDEMLQGDLNALEAYTNVQGKENIAGEHLKMLGSKLENIAKSPFIKFDIEGTIEPDEEEVATPTIQDLQKAETEVAENWRTWGDAVSKVEGEEIPIPDMDKKENVIEQLRNDLFLIGASEGIPSKIVVSHEMYKEILYDAKILTDDIKDDDKILNFIGFPIVQEAMDELYEIHYKTFAGNEEKVFTKNKIDKE